MSKIKCSICGKEMEKPKYNTENACCHECFVAAYWLKRVYLYLNNSDNVIIYNGHFYYIDNDITHSKGFDGNTFIFIMKDKRKVITNNLWSNGEIPDGFRPLLPDNVEKVINGGGII